MFIKIELDDMDREEAETILSAVTDAMRVRNGFYYDLTPELVTHVGRPGTLYSDCRCDECAAWLQGKSA